MTICSNGINIQVRGPPGRFNPRSELRLLQYSLSKHSLLPHLSSHQISGPSSQLQSLDIFKYK